MMEKMTQNLTYLHPILLGSALVLLLLISVQGCTPVSAVQSEVDGAIERLSKTMGTDFKAIREIHSEVRALPEAEVLPRLVYWLDSNTATKRRSAVHIIQHLHWEDPAMVLPELRPLLTHEEAITRGMTAAGLAALDDTDSKETIVALLDDDNAQVRQLVTWSVAEFADPALRDRLTRLLEDSDSGVQSLARNALDRLDYLHSEANVDPSQKEGVQAIWKLAGANPGDTDRIARAMARIDALPEEAREAVLQRALANESISIQNAAKIANGTIKVDSY